MVNISGCEQSVKPMIGKSIDQLMLITDKQLMLEFYVIIDFINYQFLSIFTNANQSIN